MHETWNDNRWDRPLAAETTYRCARGHERTAFGGYNGMPCLVRGCSQPMAKVPTGAQPKRAGGA